MSIMGPTILLFQLVLFEFARFLDNIIYKIEREGKPNKNYSMKNLIEKIISKVPLIGKWRFAFLSHSIPGKWGSPIPNWDQIQSEHTKIYDRNKKLSGINLNVDEQLEILKSLDTYVSDFYKIYVENCSPSNLFTLKNNIYYRFYDGANLYSFIRHFRPKRIVEIGSGYSSSLMLDVNQNYFNNEIDITFIEPNPERLLSLVKDESNINLVRKNIQDVSDEIFALLDENDFLFIDSSHISKIGSDLNKILFEILPLLKKNVFIHFHDIVFPFEYPLGVIKNRFAWNESFLLHAFLMYNDQFSISFMNSMLAFKQKESFDTVFKVVNSGTEFDANTDGSIWIRKIG